MSNEYHLEKLTKGNWVAWKCHTLRVFKAMGLQDYLLCDDKEGKLADKACAVLSGALDAEHRHSTLSYSTAKEIWLALESTYENKTMTSLAPEDS